MNEPFDGVGGGFMGLPPGSRDLLAPASRIRRRLTHVLLETFEQWGYAQAMTPLLEYYDVLSRGLSSAEKRRCVRFIEPVGGAVVAIRSDFTPQIARIVAQRQEKGMAPRVVRVCYADELARVSRDEREQTEQHQAGVELIGDPDPSADAELVALCHEALMATGLPEFRIDLSHRQVVRTVLGRLDLTPPVRKRVEGMLARKDRHGVRAVLVDARIATELAEAASSLCDLYGSPEVLAEAKEALAPVDGAVAVSQLEAVLEQLAALDPRAYERVDIDLGEVRGFDYYTGLRLRVWAPGGDRPLVRGGRYDDLLGRYGAAAPATGFAVDLDVLEAALREAEAVGDVERQSNAWVVAVIAGADGEARTQAARLAQDLRRQGERAWVEPEVDWETACRRAGQAGARGITFVGSGGFRRQAEVRDGAWVEQDV